ncbi:MAG: nitronate monooxygenase, partial [Thermoanaerobaculia bacterium]|nr:nitronate monooxygenase [Thermoanaerobaculia bacterium]
GVSSWKLARAVSSLGQLGVVSGIALDTLLARRLQDGDGEGNVRRALESFPVREMAERIWQKYFVAGGKAPEEPYQTVPMHSVKDTRTLSELCIVGNFVEVFLAREGHDNPVGINYLEKIQLPHLPSIYGAMLAGVTCVLMGAGIATRIPGVLDRLANHQPVSYELQVTGNEGQDAVVALFDPAEFFDGLPPLPRPRFFPIISSNVLATTMIKRSNGRVDGFIVEGPTAGGHNAPPRGQLRLNDAGEPQYGEKDEVDLDKLKSLGLPFWLAGGQATREKLQEALALGAAGVQVGTAFALCEESGLREDLKSAILRDAASGHARVLTDRHASPTGFPFKVAQLASTLSEPQVYEARQRVCDLGFLREVFRKPDGQIGYRCAAEPVDAYVAKGGDAEATEGRKCLCNALLANVGMGQIRRDGTVELPLVTAGDDISTIARFIRPGEATYSAKDVIEALV